MGNSIHTELGQVLSGPPGLRHQLLITCRAEVLLDGSAAIFDLSYSNFPSMRIHIPAAALPAIYAEVHLAQSLVIRRRAVWPDRGASALEEMVEVALRPTHVDFRLDPWSGDGLFVNQFDDHAPVALRLSAEALANNIDEALRVMRRHRH